MQDIVFKRTFINKIKNGIYTLLSPVVLGIILYVILSFFNMDPDTMFWIAVAASIIVFLIMLKMYLVDERIVVTVSQDGLTYVSGKKSDFYPFETCQFGYQSVSSQGSTDTIQLYVYQGDSMISLNCEPLGPRQFDALYALLKEHTKSDTIQKLN